MHTEKNISAINANHALSLFWAFVTFGRLISAVLTLFISAKYIFIHLPILITIAFISSRFFSYGITSDLILFAFAGLACSAFFPLAVSLSTNYFSEQTEKVSGIMVGVYFTGYGISAQGFGIVHQFLNISFENLFLYSAAISLLMVVLNVYIYKSLKMKKI